MKGSGAEGVLVSNGSCSGGFVLYRKNSRLVYETSYRGERT
jgi:hypothetical protein